MFVLAKFFKAKLKVFWLFVALLAAGPVAAQTPIRFSLDWRWEGSAAPFAVALDKGYFKAEGLDVTIDPGAGSLEPVARLAAGTHHMGFGDINALVRYRMDNPGSDLEAVMMIYDRPPFAIVGRRSRGISKDLASLQGKRLGAPIGDAAFAQWPILRSLNNLDDGSTTFENVGFSVREPMLAQGELDAVFGFAMTSFLGLKSRGVPMDDIVVLPMSDYGLVLYGNAIIVHGRFAKDNPEAVKGFLRALTKGIQDTIKDPSGAVDLVVKRNEMVRKDVELERLKAVLDQNILTPAVRQKGIGDIDEARFEKALEQISLTVPSKPIPKTGDIFNDAYLPLAEDRKID